MNLTEFLLARIVEDEEAARSTAADPPIYEHHGDTAVEAAANLAVSEGAWRATGDYIKRFADPARVLAECEAKRRIVESCQRLESQVLDNNLWNVDAHKEILTALALPFADHPDYREEWKL